MLLARFTIGQYAEFNELVWARILTNEKALRITL
jgi:hypothetical protein